MAEDDVREIVRQRYAEVAIAVQTGQRDSSCCGSTEAVSSCCVPTQGAAALESSRELDESFGAGLYDKVETEGLPAGVLLASLACGNPLAVADLHAGERVLDLGSGGGIDVLLSARRVGPTGRAYGLDMTAEMLDLARSNATKAGAQNVEFLEGAIEAIPLPDASVDVVISNCAINLSTDKPKVLAEMFRVLTPGGRVGVSDVVASDDVTPAGRPLDQGAGGGAVGSPSPAPSSSSATVRRSRISMLYHR